MVSPSRRLAIASARPSSASKSSVAGWVVAARGSACRVSLASNSRTGRPRRPRIKAHNRPTGPPRAISTSRLSIIFKLLLTHPKILADNRQDIDVVFAAHLSTQDRILNQGRKLGCGPNAPDRTERSAEHDRARDEFRSRSRHQVRPIAHRRRRALLIFHSSAVDGDLSAQDQFVPVVRHLIKPPERLADHFGANLLR